MAKEKKVNSSWWLIAGIVSVIIYVAFYGYFLGAWTGFPKGHDAYAHITKLKFISDFFPHYRWQYNWANGMLFSGSYAPLYYLLGLPLVKLGIAIPKVVIILGFPTFVLLGTGIFGIIYTWTKKFWAGLAGAIIALSSFSFWTWLIEGGVYPRTMGASLMVMTLWIFTWYLKSLKENSNKRVKALFLSSVFLLFLTMICHVLMALFTWLAIFLIVIFSPFSWLTRFKILLHIFGLSLLLSSFFFLPLIVSFLIGGSAATFLGVIDKVIPMPISYAITPGGIGYLALPLLSLFFILYLIFRPKSLKFIISPAKIIWPFFLLLIIFSAYALIAYTGLQGKYYYINGFIPFSAAFFITIFTTIIFGIFYGLILNNQSRALRIIFMTLAPIIVGVELALLFFNLNFLKERHIYDSADPGSAEYRAQQIIDLPKEDYQYRFATIDAFQADWFNAVYKTPQTRHYYGQGILYPSWHYWLEQAIYDPAKFTVEETKSILDWFAIKWFSYEDSISSQEVPTRENLIKNTTNRYLKDDNFNLNTIKIYNAYLEVLENKKAQPILSAVNSPNILYVGEEEGYYTLLHNLSFNNYNSTRLIPVKGKKYIDDYKILELYQFDALFLYNYQYHNKEKAYSLLQNFVRSGRGLILETQNSSDAPIKENQTVDLPEPSPVSKLSFDEIKNGQWNLTYEQEKEIVHDVNFENFSAPIYEGTPWKISAVSPQEIRSWAKPFLSNNGKPIIAGGNYGAGRVVWSGFNFNYHINANKNLDETKLLENIIEWVLQKDTGQSVNYQATFINPEQRKIEINAGSHGVLFKESFYPTWKASLEEGGQKKNLEVYYAGPGLMYAPIPPQEKAPYNVILSFKFSLSEKIGYIVSALSLIVFLVYLLEGKFFKPILPKISKFLLKPFNKFYGKAQGWWQQENEE